MSFGPFGDCAVNLDAAQPRMNRTKLSRPKNKLPTRFPRFKKLLCRILFPPWKFMERDPHRTCHGWRGIMREISPGEQEQNGNTSREPPPTKSKPPQPAVATWGASLPVQMPYGPKRWRYSLELRNAFTISAWMKLPFAAFSLVSQKLKPAVSGSRRR